MGMMGVGMGVFSVLSARNEKGRALKLIRRRMVPEGSTVDGPPCRASSLGRSRSVPGLSSAALRAPMVVNPDPRPVWPLVNRGRRVVSKGFAPTAFGVGSAEEAQDCRKAREPALGLTVLSWISQVGAHLELKFPLTVNNDCKISVTLYSVFPLVTS